jgi:putative oxygen-independent coproporphyrinogen III oxidase
VPASPPAGEPVPPDGSLPEAALSEAAARPLGVYLHVPFCSTRCGYCDFNTYTAAEAGGASPDAYVGAALAELRLAAGVLGGGRAAQTVFVGGGTPTLLGPDQLGRLLEGVRAEIGLAPDAEVTTEANPDSVTAADLEALRASGFTRISLGMQSAVPHVLALLDRKHTPGRSVAAAREAVAAGFDHVSLDLIYGTPGESEQDWGSSLDAVIDAPVDHVSAYALVVESGTGLARRVERREIDAPDDDVLADRYLAADEALSTAGLQWYEISNWAREPSAECRHNRLYWSGSDWWGIGPGAHSHVGGVRWWNVRHPRAYAARLAAQRSPGEGREILDAAAVELERVLLGIRVREGLPLEGLDVGAVQRLVAGGLLDQEAAEHGRAVLTLRGRLLADAVTRELT